MQGLIGRITSVPARIQPAAQESDAVDLQSVGQLVGVVLPETFTGTAIGFRAAIGEGGPFVPVYHEGADYSVPVLGGRYVALDPAVFCGVSYVKVVSNAVEVEVRSLQVIGRDFT